jgi:hypothetical protein
MATADALVDALTPTAGTRTLHSRGPLMPNISWPPSTPTMANTWHAARARSPRGRSDVQDGATWEDIQVESSLTEALVTGLEEGTTYYAKLSVKNT